MKTSTRFALSFFISIIIVAILWWPLGFVFAGGTGILMGLICLVPALSVVIFIGLSLSQQLNQVQKLLNELQEKVEKNSEQDNNKKE